MLDVDADRFRVRLSQDKSEIAEFSKPVFDITDTHRPLDQLGKIQETEIPDAFWKIGAF